MCIARPSDAVNLRAIIALVTGAHLDLGQAEWLIRPGVIHLDRGPRDPYILPCLLMAWAGVTQLAEWQLPKLQVAGSIPVARSTPARERSQ